MNNHEELKGLKRISELSIYSSLIITPLSIIFSMISGSVTLVVYFIWAAAAIAVKIFAMISIRIMMKENQFMFPNGTGKLENFSSFFFGVSIVPIGAYYLVTSIMRLFSPLPVVTYLLCQVPVALSLLLTLGLKILTMRIIRRNQNPSPLLSAYNINFNVSLTSDSFLFLAFLAGYLLSVLGFDYLSAIVDPVLSVILSLYMLRVGLPLIIDNFRSLIDLPLPEKDMLKILKVATEFYKEYTGFGMMFSRQSGKQKVIEIELLFDPGISLQKIMQIEQNMLSRINQDIPDVRFRLIPKVLTPGGRC
ncbi:MAG: cation transporter [Bacteroidetes bacterium]|nr:cation transporter [Bacteroidota bacterium]